MRNLVGKNNNSKFCSLAANPCLIYLTVTCSHLYNHVVQSYTDVHVTNLGAIIMLALTQPSKWQMDDLEIAVCFCSDSRYTVVIITTVYVNQNRSKLQFPNSIAKSEFLSIFFHCDTIVDSIHIYDHALQQS